MFDCPKRKSPEGILQILYMPPNRRLAVEDGFSAGVEKDAGADDHVEDHEDHALQPDKRSSA
jgi:hypothetical protein